MTYLKKIFDFDDHKLNNKADDEDVENNWVDSDDEEDEYDEIGEITFEFDDDSDFWDDEVEVTGAVSPILAEIFNKET